MKNKIKMLMILLTVALLPVPKVQAKKQLYLYAKSAILIEIDTHRVLYEKQANVRIPMASTTKIMTALVVLENAKLDEMTTISKRAAAIEGSTMKLKTGETYTIHELLYGLLLKSGNDAAIALAEHVGGSVEEFCKMMNSKAILLGATNTNFVSPHGLDNDNHYTTAYELATITCEALKYEIFREIISTKSITIKGQVLNNTNNLLYANNGIDGVKTGYTAKAGRCVVLSAFREDMRVVAVLLGCNSKNERTSDGIKIINYAYDYYNMYDLTNKNQCYATIKVKKGLIPYVNMVTEEKVIIPMTDEEYNLLKYEVNVSYKNINSPVVSGQVLGSLNIKSGDELIYTCPLVADMTVKKKTFIDYFKEIFIYWLYPTG